MEEIKPWMVKQTITFSDGTETVINYRQNGNQDAIEQASAEMVEANAEPVEEKPKRKKKVVDEE